MKLVPSWLSPLAKKFWRNHIKLIDLPPESVEAFAVFCQTYADYREATDGETRKAYLEKFLKQARYFNLYPKTNSKSQSSVGSLDELLGA